VGGEDVWVWEFDGVLRVSPWCISFVLGPDCSVPALWRFLIRRPFCLCFYFKLSVLIQSRGNLDLPPVLPWLGKTQLQILGFLTSCLLMGTHGFTSWAVTERVLLRDE
jgi:hypothetical protein